MGISREVFNKTKGFAFTRLAEDIELSIRMKKAGFKVRLIPEAFVYHKRRTSLKEFYRQVYNFGRGRVMVSKVHPEEIKLTHWFPSIFIFGAILSVLLFPFYPTLSRVLVLGYALYILLIFFHSLKVSQNLKVATLSIPSALFQLWGYGTGFIKEWVKSYTTKK
jgi:GT2 family glycosyltransferase